MHLPSAYSNQPDLYPQPETAVGSNYLDTNINIIPLNRVDLRNKLIGYPPSAYPNPLDLYPQPETAVGSKYLDTIPVIGIDPQTNQLICTGDYCLLIGKSPTVINTRPWPDVPF